MEPSQAKPAPDTARVAGSHPRRAGRPLKSATSWREMSGVLKRVMSAASLQRLAFWVGLSAASSGCLGPSEGHRPGDRFPVPPGRREQNPEWRAAVGRPFDTYGYDEPITSISLGALGQGIHDFGRPQPPAEPLDED
jgi:hypothetical protein